jgi:hypothetical protein
MADSEVETVTVRIETDDGDDDAFDVPAGLLEMVRDGDQSDAAVVGDIALLSFASRTHHLVHHSEGEPSDEVQAIEESVMNEFEDRFGQTFAEATGHSH